MISIIIGIFIGLCTSVYLIFRMIKINSLKGCVSQSKDEKELIGKEMIVYSDLRPAGTALYRGNRFDVISVGEFHKKGTTVIVDKVDGNRIIAMRK